MLPVISFVLYFLLANATYYKSESGKVSFESKANMEKIKASSKGLRGIIRAENNTFHFEVILNSFQEPVEASPPRVLDCGDSRPHCPHGILI